jgi:hypothetical protein
VADLGDVQASFAIQVAQTVREPLQRARDAADLAAAGHERDIAVPLADFLGCEHDRLELLSVTTPGPLEKPDTDEHEREADGHEPLGLDEQQVASDVLWHPTRGEHPPPVDGPLDHDAEIGRTTRPGGGDQCRVPTHRPALEPGQSRALYVRDASLPKSRRRRVQRAHEARAALASHAIVDACDDEEPDRGQCERHHERHCDREAGLERHVTGLLSSGHEPLRGGNPAPTR